MTDDCWHFPIAVAAAAAAAAAAVAPSQLTALEADSELNPGMLLLLSIWCWILQLPHLAAEHRDRHQACNVNIK